MLESWNQEVVSVNEKLQEKLYALLADVEMVGIKLLDYTVEENFRDTADLYHPELVLALLLISFVGRLLEPMLRVEHG